MACASGRFSKVVSMARPSEQSIRAILRNNRWSILMGLCTVAFLAVFMDVLGDDVAHLDSAAYTFFVLHLRRAWLTPIMQSISSLAMPTVLAVILVVIEAFAPGRLPGVCAALNLVLAVGLNFLLKAIVQRPRPDMGIRLVSESGYSFPSGHSMVAMAFYGLLLWMVLHYEKDRLVKYLCSAGFVVIILLIGISRVYLGVHYASDVIAGFCVSAAWLGIYTRIAAPLLLALDDPAKDEDATDDSAEEPVVGAHLAQDEKGPAE